MPNQSSRSGADFGGFPAPESNTTFTPNQFFDVLLRHFKNRGEVRFVSYLIRKTLGWSDENGNPKETEIFCSHRELIEKAGISRGAITQAIEDATEHGFVECVREGAPNLTGKKSTTSLYRLKFHDGPYETKVDLFAGFFSGEGNRTFIPNLLFDRLIPSESLAVIKVVGTIMRHTIGWRNKYGFRRQQVALSLRQLERLTGLAKRATREAVKHAQEAGYIRKVGQGYFDPTSDQKNEPNTYAINWEDSEEAEIKGIDALEWNGSKRTLGEENGTVQKGPSAKRFKKDPPTVQEGPAERFKKDPRIKRTPLERKPIQTTTAELQEPVPLTVFGVVVSFDFLEEKLREHLVSKKEAKRLLKEHSLESVFNQIEALEFRNAKGNRPSNPGGFLKQAIDEDYSFPPGFKSRRQLGTEHDEKKEAQARRKEAIQEMGKKAEAHNLAMDVEFKNSENRVLTYLDSLSEEKRLALETKALGKWPVKTEKMKHAIIHNHVISLIGAED